MSHICDASAIINLVNGGVFRQIIAHPGIIFHIAPIVEGECSSDAGEIEWAKQNGFLRELDDSLVSADHFIDLLDRHGLGAGETECIAFAEQTGFSICCDDRKARGVAASQQPAINTIGTLGILRHAVAGGVITREAAHAAYELMISKGGYLPPVQLKDF